MFGKSPLFGPVLGIMLGTIDGEQDWEIRHELFCEQRTKWVQGVEDAKQWPAMWPVNQGKF
jgi:hypothetical protein